VRNLPDCRPLRKKKQIGKKNRRGFPRLFGKVEIISLG